jgi:hypothetical protein
MSSEMKTSDIETELVGYFGSDITVVNAARVSFSKQSEENLDGSLSEKDCISCKK